MKNCLLFMLALLISGSLTSQVSPDFEPCIGSGGMSGLNNLRLLMATSDDGIHWDRTNLVLSDRSSVADGLVLPSGRILVYYVAGCLQVGGSEQLANHIKVAISDNGGKSWSYKNVQFNNLPTGGTLPVDPNVVLMDNGDIHMLATIDPDQTGSLSPCSYSALSTDGGFTFTLSSTAVYSISGTDVLDPENFRFGTGNWKLWAGGTPGKNVMGFSTNEAASFTDQGDFCSATNVDNPSECYIAADVMKFDASTYKMFAFGTSPSGQLIRSLSSTDGDTWTLDSTIVLTVQPSTGVEYLDVWAPTVIKMNDTSFIMIYETRIPSSASTSCDSIAILQGDTTLITGDTLYLTARSYFPDQSIRDISYFGTWNSTNPSVASINGLGKLTALTQGITYVSMTYDSITSDSVLISVGLPTFVGPSGKKKTNYFVYPNPVTDEFTIEIQGHQEVHAFEIFNSMGQVVLTGTVPGKAVVQMHPFSPGIYFIKLEVEQGFEYRKIIKE